MSIMRVIAPLFAVGALAGGCSDSGSDDAAPDQNADTEATDAPDERDVREACDLVSVDELSEVVGGEVVIDEEGTTEFGCAYTAAGPPTFLFTINVFFDRGDADAVIDIALGVDGGGGERIDLGDGGWVIFDGAQVGFVDGGTTYQVDGRFASLGDNDPTEVNLAIAGLIEDNL